MELEALLAAAQDEMEKKDQAILELADALDVSFLNLNSLNRFCLFKLKLAKANEEEEKMSSGIRGRSGLQKRSRATSQ